MPSDSLPRSAPATATPRRATSDCATSVRVTSPTLKRSRVCFSCSCSTSTLRRCRSRIAVSRSTFMYCGRGIEQHGLRGIAQGLAAGQHRGLGLARQAAGALPVVHRLHQPDIAAARADIGVGLGEDAAGERGRFEVLVAGIHLAVDARPIARERLRHALIGRAQGGALRIQRRIVAVGLRECRFQRFGASRATPQARPQ